MPDDGETLPDDPDETTHEESSAPAAGDAFAGADVEVLALLDDDYARCILVAASEEPMTARELVEACDASDPTVYRRLERLRAAELVAEEQTVDPDGHHRKAYRTRVRRVLVAFGDRYEVAVEEAPRDPADTFTRVYEELTGDG